MALNPSPSRLGLMQAPQCVNQSPYANRKNPCQQLRWQGSTHQHVRANPHTADVCRPLRARVKTVRASMFMKFWASRKLTLSTFRHMHARKSPVTSARNSGPNTL